MNASETIWYIYAKFNKMIIDYDFGEQIKTFSKWFQMVIYDTNFSSIQASIVIALILTNVVSVFILLLK